MPRPKVLAIFLDGYEQSLATELIQAGLMPSFAKLQRDSARYLLDYGPAQRTGLAGEHVSTGLSPEAADRWAAISFDPSSYAIWQEGTRLQPFPARLEAQTVVFDATYFDLANAPGVQGLVAWGGHDPGVERTANPPALSEEFERRFGTYPAKKWIYGFAWPSPERSLQMGRDLAAAVDLRTTAARWLLDQRLPDWDLALIGISETHSVIEGLWHGIDPTHRLNDLPSSGPAREGIRAVYIAVDRLVGELSSAFPEAYKVVFAMGGMGPNHSDVPSMVLLPELLFRNEFGRPLLQLPHSGRSLLEEEEDPWRVEVPPPHRGLARRIASALTHRAGPEPYVGGDRHSVDWIPAARYQPYWPNMRAFALPSYYDGRIRINLAGRESLGKVRPSDYAAECDAIEELLRSTADSATGECAVESIERFEGDPHSLGPTGSDMTVVWRDCALAMQHPVLGMIGPLPFRRTGGHTGPYGFAFVSGDGVDVGEHGVRSSFDVVPTIIRLLGLPVPSGISGGSLLPLRVDRAPTTTSHP